MNLPIMTCSTSKKAVAVAVICVSVYTYAAAQSSTTSSAHALEMHGQMEKMHKDMMAPMTGNPDIDFAAMMIPHHQSAVDMAKTQLKYGKDEKLRELAEQIIASQEKEIEILQERLKALKKQHGLTPDTSSTGTMTMHGAHPHPM